MASGDPIAVDWARAKKENFIIRVTGLPDIALESLDVDIANNLWRATPVGGWPNVDSDNGTPTVPGSAKVISAAAPNQLVDVEGNKLPAGLEFGVKSIQIAPPALVGTLTATFVRGWGEAADLGTPITVAGSLGSGQLVMRVTSAEN